MILFGFRIGNTSASDHDRKLLEQACRATSSRVVEAMIPLVKTREGRNLLRYRVTVLEEQVSAPAVQPGPYPHGPDGPYYASREPLVDGDGNPIEPGSGSDDFSDYVLYEP